MGKPTPIDTRWIALVVLVAEPTSVTGVPAVVVVELGVSPAMIGPPAAVAGCWPAITATPESTQPTLAALLALFTSVFQRSGARPDIGTELYSRMCDAGLQPHPMPLAEFVLHPARGTLAYRRWALFARSMLPKIVEYGLSIEEEIRQCVEHDLRDELLAATGLVPPSWLMISQWARVPVQ